MLEAPFREDEAVARRMAALAAGLGSAVEADVAAIFQGGAPDALAGSTITRDVAASLAKRHGLASTTEVALLALPVAETMARAPISDYRVPAIGIEAGTGDLLFGANLEFPGNDLGSTVHAEGFVALRSRRRGRGLTTLVVRRARPCAFCRQTLAELAGADALRVVDPLGHDVSLEDLYPWSFRPQALGVAGDSGAITWHGLGVDDDIPEDVAALLVDAGSRAHAPYTRAPSAVALRLRDGRLIGAGCVESVAFNPTTTALQAALVEVVAARAAFEDIVQGWLARTPPGQVDPAPPFRVLLDAVAPKATARVADWRRAG